MTEVELRENDRFGGNLLGQCSSFQNTITILVLNILAAGPIPKHIALKNAMDGNRRCCPRKEGLPIEKASV
jgi:hypothetical protein